MRYLIENGVELDAADQDGNTALHVAACRGNIESVHLLLDAGSSTTATNNSGDAPIHTAAREKSAAALKTFLVHSRVDWDLKGFRNRTLMHIIAEADNLECCKALHEEVVKKMGCGENHTSCHAHSSHSHGERNLCACIKDDDGLTAVHLAARMNSHKVLEFIIQQCRRHCPDFVLE